MSPLHQAIVDLARQGMTSAEIAEAAECGRVTVRKVARAAGIKLARGGWTAEEALRLHAKLGSTQEVAEVLGTSRHAICARLRRHYPHWSNGTYRAKCGRRYTAAERDECLRRYIRGDRVADITAELGPSSNTIQVWARDFGVARSGGRPRSYTIDEAVDLYAKLGSQKDVGEVLGVSATSVGRALREAGVR